MGAEGKKNPESENEASVDVEPLKGGIYDCNLCIEELGCSAELVVLGHADPRTVCDLHSKNTAKDFTLRTGADGRPLDIGRPKLQIQIPCGLAKKIGGELGVVINRGLGES
ncbi:hypothetical protein IPG41_02230 [Candidatus Peregrinibacteria bacterium]|nr:MAG: hypothetical protein IPG41_02230 [Candidatus Peregrinibacteria bacterium]